MSEPIYGPSMELLWDRLPDVYRRQDANQNWVLKRFLNSIGSQFDEVTNCFDRLSYVPRNQRDRNDERMPLQDFIVSTADSVVVDPNDETIWQAIVQSNETFYQLLHQSNNASISFHPYLTGGTYTISIDYVPKPDNGVAVLMINGKEASTFIMSSNGGNIIDNGDGTYTFLAGTATTSNGAISVSNGLPATDTGNGSYQLFDQTSPQRYTFTTDIDRGYADISVKFVNELQPNSNTHINVGNFQIRHDVAVYPNSTSDLVNPYSADESWLPWLAQLVGVDLDKSIPIIDQRASIVSANTGFNAGTRSAIEAIIQPQLTGTRRVHVVDHSNATGAIGSGGQWDVLVITRTSETPAGLNVPEYIRLKGGKPAGVALYHRTYEASWDVIQARRPKWNDWEVPWTIFEETGLD